MSSLDWSKYPNFSEAEFRCSHTGKCKMRPEFMEIMQQARTMFRKPMVITSGFRDPSHPVEAAKNTPGEHTFGVAADIACHGQDAMDLIVIFYGLGIRRLGVSQKGGFSSRFLHVGMGDKQLNFPPALWTY